MESYLQAIKVITDNLAAAGKKVTDEDLILYVLGGLGPEYESLLVTVTTRPYSITVDELSRLLFTHEIRLEFLYANSPTANVVYSYHGTSTTTTHTDKYVFSPSFGSATRPSTLGYSVRTYRCRFNQNFCSSSSSTTMIATPSIVSDLAWYSDSRATDHLTANLDNLSIHSPYNDEQQILVGN
ncbi:uncharacterized protein LOC124930387 [Impatiens glandulifera]|uniref:uncharacterized protein LOC124930387 n=1 Tax=Impatiens glandulifera TaxID=253017 RepID=UPI001FB0E373|nr:uncharacterized protein LOC124930387 [Impatiens glandulifera]